MAPKRAIDSRARRRPAGSVRQNTVDDFNPGLETSPQWPLTLRAGAWTRTYPEDDGPPHRNVSMETIIMMH